MGMDSFRFRPELKIVDFCDWLCQKARSKPQKPEQFRTWYEQISWQVAIHMRVGKSFVEATEAVQTGIETYQEAMVREILPSPKKPLKRKRDNEEHEARLSGTKARARVRNGTAQ